MISGNLINNCLHCSATFTPKQANENCAIFFLLSRNETSQKTTVPKQRKANCSTLGSADVVSEADIGHPAFLSRSAGSSFR